MSEQPTEPRVVLWYRAYCAMMTLLYLACMVGGAILLALHFGHQRNFEFLIQGAILLIIGLPLMIAFALGFFLPPRSWTWVYGLVLIGIGMTSACCLPICIPLLIYWIKPEAKAWFGRA